MTDKEKLELARKVYLAYMIDTAEERDKDLAPGEADKTMSGGNDWQHGVKIALRAIEAVS